MKVKELYELCKKEVERGNSERTIFISSDDEGNDYHELFFGFESNPPDMRKLLEWYRIEDMQINGKPLEEIILLG